MTKLDEFITWLKDRMEAKAMAAVFLILLRMTRSKRDLDRLHNLLPLNCQLLRPDFIRLEEVWDEMYPKQRPQRKISEHEARGRLVEACGTANLLPYYARQKLYSGFGDSGSLLHDAKKIAAFGARSSLTLNAPMRRAGQVDFDALLDMTGFGGGPNTRVKLECRFAASCFEDLHSETQAFFLTLSFPALGLNRPFLEYARKVVGSGQASLALPLNVYRGDFSCSACLTFRFGPETAWKMAMLVNPPRVKFVEVETGCGADRKQEFLPDWRDSDWGGTVWPYIEHEHGVIRPGFCPALGELLTQVGFRDAVVTPYDWRREFAPMASAHTSG